MTVLILDMSGFLESPSFETDLVWTLTNCLPIETVCFASDLKTFMAGFDPLLLLLLCVDPVLELVLVVVGRGVTAGAALFDAIVVAGTGRLRVFREIFVGGLCSILVVSRIRGVASIVLG